MQTLGSESIGKKAGKEKQTSLKVIEPTELMKFLLVQIQGKSRNNIKSLLTHGQISVNDRVTTQYNELLEPGQTVTINWNRAQEERHPQGLKILFEDPYLIIIEKQAGLLSIGTAKEREQTAYSLLSEHVKRQDPKKRIFVVHRLDRDTSGVMMFAKSEEVKQTLQNAWKEAVLERTYVVIAEGVVSKAQGTITSWLKESKTLLMYSSRIPNDGQKAVTHYQVLKQSKNYTLLAVQLETGRKNQIRVHMQDLGHSIVGDKKYGATKNPINRLGLHAQVLAFRHPVTGEEMRFETDLPKEFSSLFN